MCCDDAFLRFLWWVAVISWHEGPETVWSEKEVKPIVDPSKSVLDTILDTTMKGKKLK